MHQTNESSGWLAEFEQNMDAIYLKNGVFELRMEAALQKIPLLKNTAMLYYIKFIDIHSTWNISLLNCWNFIHQSQLDTLSDDIMCLNCKT